MSESTFFANCSWHPSNEWSREQVMAASKLVDGAGIKDYEFPYIDPWEPTEQVGLKAVFLRDQIVRDGCTAAMIQGEYTFTVKLISMLQISHVDCYIATLENGFEQLPNGKAARTFCQFRLA